MSSMTRTIERGNRWPTIYRPNTMRAAWYRRQAKRAAEMKRSENGRSVLASIRGFGHSPINPFAASGIGIGARIASFLGLGKFFTPKATRGQ